MRSTDSVLEPGARVADDAESAPVDATKNGHKPGGVTDLASKARVFLKAGKFKDDPAGLTAHLAKVHDLTREAVAPHVAVAVAEVEDGVTGTARPHHTDTGNATRLVDAFGGRVRYLYDGGRGSWYAWDGRRWEPDATGAIERYAKRTVRLLYEEASKIEDDKARDSVARWAMNSEAAGRLDAMMRLARSDERIVATAASFDADSWALNVANGTIDLRTGQLGPHTQAAMHSKITKASYRPGSPAPLWDAFLAEVLPDPDVRHFVQKLAGYSLTGEIGENVLAFPYGSGANGKSVFLGVLRESFGDYATEAAPDLLVARRERGIPVDVIDLRGFRFVTTMEVEGGRQMATDVMKRITGESKLKARRMRQNFEEFDNVTKLWMAANDLPAVDGLDEAIWRRLRLIPFEVTIDEDRRDPGLAGKLLAECDGVLAWAVEGCLAWQSEGLKPPAAVLAETLAYRQDSNPLRDWAESRCELDPDAITPATKLREDYDRWARDERLGNRRVPRGTKWAGGLERLGCWQEGDSKGREFIDGKHAAVWHGVRLRDRDRNGGLGV